MTGSSSQSLIQKHSVVLAGHKTSISLEDAFWIEIKRMAIEADKTVAALVEEIDRKRKHANLSSALRLAVLADLHATIASQAKLIPAQQAAE